MGLLDSLLHRVSGLMGSGNVITEERPVSGFTQVVCSGIGNLIIDQTGAESLSITAEDNIVPLITSEVSEGALRISMKHGFNPHPTKPITYHLTVKQLESIKMSGVGNVTSQSLDARDLTIMLSGAGSGTIEGLTVLQVTVALSGAGSLTLAGLTTEQNITLSGVGSYEGDDLASEKATVRVSGTGKATVRVSKELSATVSGVGNITYIGDPLLSSRVSGVGKIVQKKA